MESFSNYRTRVPSDFCALWGGNNKNSRIIINFYSAASYLCHNAWADVLYFVLIDFRCHIALLSHMEIPCGGSLQILND